MDHLMGRNGITSSFTFEVLFLSYFQCNMGLQSSPFSKKLSLTWLPRGFFLTIHPYVILILQQVLVPTFRLLSTTKGDLKINISMAKQARKKNLTIQMLMENSLNSFLNLRLEKTLQPLNLQLHSNMAQKCQDFSF